MGSENSSELSVPGSALLIGGLQTQQRRAALTRLPLYDLFFHTHLCPCTPETSLLHCASLLDSQGVLDQACDVH